MAQPTHLGLVLRRSRDDDWRTPSPGPHVVVCIEVGDGIFEVSCRCGKQVSTPWGEDAARRRARAHLIVNGVKIPSGTWE